MLSRWNGARGQERGEEYEGENNEGGERDECGAIVVRVVSAHLQPLLLQVWFDGWSIVQRKSDVRPAQYGKIRQWLGCNGAWSALRLWSGRYADKVPAVDRNTSLALCQIGSC